MKLFRLAAIAAFILSVTPSLAVQKNTPVPKQNAPAPAQGEVKVTTNPVKLPEGAKPAEVQDVRLVTPEDQAIADPYQLERLGVAAANQGNITQARDFFEHSWKTGELPTAPFNLACLNVREKKIDDAFKELDRAIAAGFDDEGILMNDADLASIRSRSEFGRILAGVRKNRETGDASVVKEGVFVAPEGAVQGVLLLLHDASSDPFTASGPFMSEARARGLFVAVPRGPSRVGKKRFGWGAADRAIKAAQASLEAVLARTSNSKVPVLLLGIGRGGVLAFTVAVKRPGPFASVGSIGGPFSPTTEKLTQKEVKAALMGRRLVFGIPQDARQPGLVTAVRKGTDSLQSLGFSPVLLEWPGTSNTLPDDVGRAVRETLDALMGKKAS